MKNYSAIIADDEENLCSHLESLLQKCWPDLQLLAVAHNGADALGQIKQQEPDIAFLDIKMPLLSGLDVAKHAAGLCRVVFITAYDEFAIQAFEHNAIDYLLKPVTEARLEKTIQRLKAGLAVKLQTQPDWTQLINRLSTTVQETSPAGKLQWIRAGKTDKTVLIPVDEVCYFSASDKYTSVVTEVDEYLIRKPIKELVEELNTQQFWQINRGVIVNVNCIASTRRELNGRCEVHLKNRNEILLSSRKYAHLFKKM